MATKQENEEKKAQKEAEKNARTEDGLEPVQQVAAAEAVETEPKDVEEAIQDGYVADLHTHINGGAGSEPLSPMQVAQNRRDASGESAYRPNKKSK